MLGVQNGVLHALALEHFRQQFGFFDGDCADQYGLSLLMTLLDLLDDCAEFTGFGLIDNVVVVDTDHGLVGRNLHNVNFVDCGEFLLFGQRRASHAGELGIQTEEILEGDGSERLILACDGDALLRLDRLMQTLVIAPAVHQSACEFIDDDDLSVFNDIVNVALHNAARTHCLIDMVQERGVFNVR